MARLEEFGKSCLLDVKTAAGHIQAAAPAPLRNTPDGAAQNIQETSGALPGLVLHGRDNALKIIPSIAHRTNTDKVVSGGLAALALHRVGQRHGPELPT